MNERIKELAEQAGCVQRGVVWLGNNSDFERFAELVRQDERKKCAADYLDDCARAVEAARLEEKEKVLQEISDIGQWDTSDMAHRSGGLSVDMSTKPENIDTSPERVHEIDKPIHEEIERLKAEIKRLKELADYRLKLLMKIHGNELDAIERGYFAGKEAGVAEAVKREWVGLTDEEIVACGWCDLRFARAIEAKLRERNT
jgi:hypothetical protein